MTQKYVASNLFKPLSKLSEHEGLCFQHVIYNQVAGHACGREWRPGRSIWHIELNDETGRSLAVVGLLCEKKLSVDVF